MNLSAPFIARPVATTLLAIGIALAGALAFLRLPVSPLPEVDFPTISVQASLPGASPDTVASSVASPLERALGRIAAVTEMTSTSSIGSTGITLQFDLNRDIDGAARDVQAAINAAHADLPTSLRSNPIYRKINPADAPILLLDLTSKTMTPGQMYDSASNILQQRLSQLDGIGQVTIGGSALPAVRVELNPHALSKYGVGLEDVRAALAAANANSPKGAIEGDGQHLQIYTNDQANHAAEYRPLVIAYRNGAPVHLTDVAEVADSVEDLRNEGLVNGKPGIILLLFSPARRKHHQDRRRRQGGAAAPPRRDAGRDRRVARRRSEQHDPRFAAGHGMDPDDRDRARHADRFPLSARHSRDAHSGDRGAALDRRHVRGNVSGGLQPQHPVADGADHRDRLRRRRRDRRARERHPLSRGGHAAGRGRPRRRRRGRLHRDVDQHLAYRRFHPDPFHGRHSRAAVPRIRRDALFRDSRSRSRCR